jgi:hypothetical protein
MKRKIFFNNMRGCIGINYNLNCFFIFNVGVLLCAFFDGYSLDVPRLKKSTSIFTIHLISSRKGVTELYHYRHYKKNNNIV